jgi:hypothetical protein
MLPLVHLVVSVAAPGRQLLFAGLIPPKSRSLLPSCPTETPIASSGSRAVEWKVSNHARVPLQMFWISFEGAEQKMEKLGPGENSTVMTFEGHAWRLRSPQGVLVAQSKSSSIPLHVHPCQEMHGADAIALPSDVARTLAATEDGVYERWADATLTPALAKCQPWTFLSREAAFMGFHVLCILRSEGEADAVAVFSEGLWSDAPTVILPWGAATDLAQLALLVQHGLSLPRRAAHLQPSGFFTPDGLRLTSLDALLRCQSVLLYEGGQWIWPPIAVNHTWSVYANGHAVSDAHGDGSQAVADSELGTRVALQLRTVSLRPVSFEVVDFLQGDEAEHMKNVAAPRTPSLSPGARAL